MEPTKETLKDAVVNCLKNIYDPEIPVNIYDNDVITIEVKNKIQEEELDKRRRVILEYWRNHFQLNVDDLEIVVNEDKVTSTAILSADEQFQKMKEQNPELLDFLNALNFRMKD